MKWNLDFKFDAVDYPAEYQDKILMAGSCFAENIGRNLVKYKMDTLINPHGIMYNPASVVQSLDDCLENRKYHEDDLFFDHGLWHSWNHHEHFSHPEGAVCVDSINDSIQKSHHQLLHANWLIITLGTAGVYRLKATGKTVGNCHKRPANDFDFFLMKPEEVIATLDKFIHRLFQVNKKVRIIFTVSPVRYIRHGLIESNLSKSTLLYSVHHLIHKFDRLYYFPAYEVLIDELRDYRFYAEDMVHPNSVATEYIFNRFIDFFLSDAAKRIFHEVYPVIQAAAHRPLHPETEEYKKFIQNQLKKIKELEKSYPFLSFGDEIFRE